LSQCDPIDRHWLHRTAQQGTVVSFPEITQLFNIFLLPSLEMRSC
jgi:hypothetical protein